jgi:hydrogenase maturation protease
VSRVSRASRVLVAGMGNIFLSDDAFGVEVVRRLLPLPLPQGVEVRDFGIAGVHLAYQLLDGGYDALVLVDALPFGGSPGDLCVMEPELDDEGEVAVDAHGMQPDAVLRTLEAMGGRVGRVLVVGCQPSSVEEGMELSPPVAASVDRAVDVVRELLDELTGGGSRAAPDTETGRPRRVGSGIGL